MSENSDKATDAAREMAFNYLKLAPSRGHTMEEAINVLTKFGFTQDKALLVILEYRSELAKVKANNIAVFSRRALVSLVLCLIGAIPLIFSFEMNIGFWIILGIGAVMLPINLFRLLNLVFSKEAFPA